MFLKSLTLKGFKSFAEATTMELEPGVTVVVGPNGSGKSNVVDAIAWVLGAQAPSSVRSQKMDDVIFAGTASRPALGRAEVALTIDNSAGLLGIEFSEVTVRRTLFRTGESEYAINNVPCRLLDVQELLSDAGVGRQQHVIVSQGQIDAVLNARPEDRRGIIEEAAGVLKYRKRKEKAERRLDATEANLLRVQDLLREVRRQLRPLERQAEAARRHGELIGELTALRVYVAGREIAALRTKLTALAAAKLDGAESEARLKSELARLDTDVMTVGAELTARGAEDVGDRLRQVEQLRERARGLGALIAERRRALERDRGQLLDAGVVASLEGDAARCREELATVHADLARLEPEAAELEEDEAAFALERDDALSSLDPVPAASAASAIAEVRGELRSLRAAAERVEGELRRARARREQLAAAIAELDVRGEELRGECNAAELVEGPLVAEIEQADAEREAAGAAVDAARVERQEAAEQASDLARPRRRAPARAGRRPRPRRGRAAGRLRRRARHAARPRAHRRRLGAGRRGGARRGAHRGRRGRPACRAPGPSTRCAARTPPAPSSRSGSLRAPRRRSRRTAASRCARTSSPTIPRSAGLLDACSPAAVRVDDLDQAIAPVPGQPGGRRRDQVRRPASTPAAGASAPPPRAVSPPPRSTDASARAEAAAVRLRAGGAGAGRGRAPSPPSRLGARDELAARLDANDARFTKASEALARRPGRPPRGPGRAGAARPAASPSWPPTSTPSGPASPSSTCSCPISRPASRPRPPPPSSASRPGPPSTPEAAVLVGRRRDLEVRAAGLRERAQVLERRLEEAERRLAADAEARTVAEQRRVEVERSLRALDRLAALVAAHRTVVDAHHGELVERRRQQSEQVRALSERLERLRAERVTAERSLDETRERARRAEVDEAEARLRLESAVEMLRHDLDVEPAAAEAAELPPLPEGVSAQARVRELDRELRLLGPINPLALEEFTELQQRHAFLEEQLEDVRTTRRDLNRIIKAVDQEIQSVFAAAYADVSANFTTLFEGLFPGRQRQARPDPARRPPQHRHRGRGQAERQERQEALVAVGRRAQPHRAGLPVRRLPQPAVAVLRHGRGRGRARRRQPPPLPRPRRRVPPRGAAPRRQPPEAHDGGRRQPARRHDAARRVEPGASSSGSVASRPPPAPPPTEHSGSADRRSRIGGARQHGRLGSVDGRWNRGCTWSSSRW